MSSLFTATGVSGQVRVGYRTALVLGRWSLSSGRPTLGKVTTTIQAAVAARDDFWSTQEPKDIYLQMPVGWWAFKNVSVSDRGSEITVVTFDEPIEQGTLS